MEDGFLSNFKSMEAQLVVEGQVCWMRLEDGEIYGLVGSDGAGNSSSGIVPSSTFSSLSLRDSTMAKSFFTALSIPC